MSATILTVIVLIVMWVVVLVPLLVRRAEDTEENVTYWAPAMTEPIVDEIPYTEAADGTDDGEGRYREGQRQYADATVRRGEGDGTRRQEQWQHDTTGRDADGLVRQGQRQYGDAAVWAEVGVDPDGEGRPFSAHGDRRGAALGEYESERGRPGIAFAAGRPARREVTAPAGRATTLARRRRVLGMLAGLVVATAAIALLSTATVWLANALCDGLLLGYLGKLRADARREARRAVAQRRPTRQPRTEYVRPVVATPPARRPSRPIALDDEDPYFAQLEVRYPRAANE